MNTDMDQHSRDGPQAQTEKSEDFDCNRSNGRSRVRIFETDDEAVSARSVFIRLHLWLGFPPMRVRIVVSGRVQGVGFRYAAVTQARRLGLAGWARNQPDGSVEIVAEGAPGATGELIAWCRRGPPAARVASVQYAEEVSNEPLGEFGVRW
jgi:acylphosphatase